MKSKIIDILDEIFLDKISPVFFNLYERWIMYRIRRVWGKAHLRRIKNKGKNVNMVGYSRILNPEGLIIGDNVRIGYNCFFYCLGGIEIGDNTILSRNITIYSSNHNYNADMIPYDDSHMNKKVTIGKGVWIGMGVNIIPGVTIGDGAIVGMGVTVSRDVAPGEILVSSQNRVIAHRDMDKFKENLDQENIFSLKHPKK